MLVRFCALFPELFTLNSGTIYGLRVNNMKLDRWGPPFFSPSFVSNKLKIMILRNVKLSAAPML